MLEYDSNGVPGRLRQLSLLKYFSPAIVYRSINIVSHT